MSAKWIWVGLLSLIFLIGGTLLAMRWMDHSATNAARSKDRPLSGVTAPAVQAAFPVLQPSQRHDQLPWQDLRAQRALESAYFDRLGWSTTPGQRSPRVPDTVIAEIARRQGPATRPGGAP